MILPDKIIRSKRKTLSLCVKSTGEVIVRAPLKISEEKIHAFVQEKQGWLESQKRKRERAGVRLPTETVDGYPLPILGEYYQITLFDGAAIRLDTQAKRLYLPKEKTEKRLVVWLKENALRIFTLQTERLAAKMGLRFQSVSISLAKTRWGTCSSEGKIRYTYRLLYAPREVVDYVIVHELAHLKFMNHGKAFWSLVERYVPEYKRLRKWLKDRGALMEIF